MRIALYHNLPSGGAKRALFETTRRMAETHEIDVFTLSSAEHDFADIRPYASSHKIYEFHPQPLLSSPFGRFNQAIRLTDLRRLDRLSRHIAKEIENGGYDVLLAHPCQIEKSPSVLRYVSCFPKVYYCQEPLRRLYEPLPARPYDDSASTRRNMLNRLDPLPGIYHSSLKKTDRRNIRSADRILVNSMFMQDSVKSIYDVDPYVSYLGVDVEQFRPLGLDRQAYVLSVGSLTPLKGFDFLIESLTCMPSSIRPELIIASNAQNPPERAFLQTLAMDKEVTLTLAKNIIDAHLVQLYNEAIVTVYAPVREPFGLVALESMSCGTPVVSVDEGGMKETIVHNDTGMLVKRDPDAFARTVAELITDNDRLAVLGANGRKHVLKNWTWDSAVQTLESHLLAQINALPKGTAPASASIH